MFLSLYTLSDWERGSDSIQGITVSHSVWKCLYLFCLRSSLIPFEVFSSPYEHHVLSVVSGFEGVVDSVFVSLV